MRLTTILAIIARYADTVLKTLLSPLRSLRNLFHRSNRSILVELGENWAKIAILRSGLFGSNISDLNVISSSGDEEASWNSLSLVLAREPFANIRKAILLVPSQFIVARSMTLPSAKMKEIEEMAALQANRVSPFSSEEEVSDFACIAGGSDSPSRVTIYIARESVIQKRIDKLSKIGKVVVSVKPAVIWASRWFHKVFEGKSRALKNSVVIVDRDFAGSDVYYSDSGAIEFVRRIPIGTVSLNYPDSNNSAVLEEFCREFEKTVLSIEELDSVQDIDEIIFTGAKSGSNELADELGARLSVITVFMSPASILEQNGEVHLLQSLDDRFSVVSMLGLRIPYRGRDTNLLPKARKFRQRRVERAKAAIKTTVLVVTLLLLGVVYFELNLSKKAAYLDELERQLASTSELARDISQLKRTTDLILREVDISPTVLEILYELHIKAPPGIEIEYFEYLFRNRALVKGRARDSRDVFKLVAALKEMPVFEDVSLDYVNAIREGTGSESVFQVSMSMEQ